MTVEEAKEFFPSETWVMAELPDGEIDAVMELTGEANGVFLAAESGYDYHGSQLKFLDDTYLELEVLKLMTYFSPEKIIAMVKKRQEDYQKFEDDIKKGVF